ncbi:MAG: hypothetical protein EZS28_034026 [Streblomastix strix]|uniref:Uncharacterized protein n=1 Tax=Streblomastix strix TaxID=222440 RepID=A0A5J4UIG7_9EUKA|nr:MAG: hypothetical protein EZS28_034026 [Streblomastix strix]
MHTKFIIASRDGIFNGWLLVVQNISTVIQTILVEESPLASALLNLATYGIYGEYVIFKSPFKSIGGNQLGAVCSWIAASDGIVNLILTPLNVLSSMNSVGLKIFANIIFYESIIVIITISAFAGQTLVGRIGENLWVIRPVTILRETQLSNVADMNKEVFNLKKKLNVEQQITNSNIAMIPGSYSRSTSQQSSVSNISAKTSLIKRETVSNITDKNKKNIKLQKITFGFRVMKGEDEEIGYILDPILEEVPKQFHQHLGVQEAIDTSTNQRAWCAQCTSSSSSYTS